MLLVNFIYKNKKTLLYISIVILGLVAAVKICDEFFRLLFSDAENAGIDLKVLKRGIKLWFSDRQAPQELRTAMYPPASYAMLWPIIGWIKLPVARIVWAVIFIPSLAIMSYLFLKHSLAKSTQAAVIALIIPLSLNATGITIGNGQVGIQVLVLMMGALLVIQRKDLGIASEIVVAVLTVMALIKPSVTAPFFWLILFVYPNYRVILTTVGLYIFLTVIPFYFRDSNIFDYFFFEENIEQVKSMVKGTYSNVVRGTIRGSNYGGYGDLHSLLVYLGYERFNLIASGILFMLFGLWVYLNKKANFWLLLSVTAIFSRLWMYHRAYDDVLLILPMLTLFRLINLQSLNIRIRHTSLVLLIITTVAMLAPARLQAIAPWSYLFVWGHIILWFVLLFFFFYLIRKEHTSEMQFGS